MSIDLWSKVRTTTDTAPLRPVHPAVLSVSEADGETMAFVCWQDPGGQVALHRELRTIVEGALLARLSAPPSERLAAPSWLRLAIFAELEWDPQPALAAFGMERCEPQGPGWRRALGHMNHEGSLLGLELPDSPASTWEVPVRGPGEVALRAEEALGQDVDGSAFGATPGLAFRRLMGALGHPEATPDLNALELLEEQLVSYAPGPIRWIPAGCFQALSDAMGVIAHMELGCEVQWAVLEPSEDGTYPAPWLRIGRDGHTHDLAVGLALLHWCVMPLMPEERVPPLRDWLLDQIEQLTTASKERSP